LGWLNYEQYDPNLLPKSKDDLKCELYPKNAEQVWESYVQTSENASADFYDDQVICDAIERTHDIMHLEIGDIHPNKAIKLPNYVVPAGVTEDKALLDACKDGLVWRKLDEKQEYIDRLKYELKIIRDKKFSKYFLTMKSIMDLAREKMLIGVARGSSGGSLVAYVLGITDLDPLKYGLLFTRFMNPSRMALPDIDSDIADRDLLISLM